MAIFLTELGTLETGVYYVPADSELRAAEQQARELNLRVFELDLFKVPNHTYLITRLEEALQVPYVSGNWNALDELFARDVPEDNPGGCLWIVRGFEHFRRYLKGEAPYLLSVFEDATKEARASGYEMYFLLEAGPPTTQ